MKKLIVFLSIVTATTLNAETRLDVSADGAAPAVQELLAKGHEVSDPCSNLVRECFTYDKDDFTTCLSTAGQHPFCDGTPLGKLTLKRWGMSSGEENVRAFTGPSLTDRECMKNFDAEFSGYLTQGNIPAETIAKLDSTLNSCNREAPVGLSRP